MKRGTLAAWCLSITGIVVMVLVITHGFVHGEFYVEGKWLIDHPWGRVTLVDLYLGFFLFSGWVISRERSAWRGAMWTLGLMLWGHLAGAVYVVHALVQSKGDRKTFWLGVRHEPKEPEPAP